MSQFSIYVKFPDYLSQWLHHEYWDEETKRVEFPRGTAPHAVLKSLLRPLPPTWRQGDTTGLLRIKVPTFKGINPATFNYLSPKGEAALASACRTLFKAQLFLELSPLFEHDVEISDVIYDFMDRHGIEADPKSWESIRQMYFRMRKKTFNRT